MMMVLPCSRFSAWSRPEFRRPISIQVARRFIAQQQRRIGDNARAMPTRCCSPPESVRGKCRARWDKPTIANAVSTCFAAFRFRKMRQEQRQFHVALRREHRQQIVKLKTKPTCRARQAASCRSDIWSTRSPPMLTNLSSGDPGRQSNSATSFARTGGPHQRQELPVGTSRFSRQHVDFFGPAPEYFVHVSTWTRVPLPGLLAIAHGLASLLARHQSSPWGPSTRRARRRRVPPAITTLRLASQPATDTPARSTPDS